MHSDKIKRAHEFIEIYEKEQEMLANLKKSLSDAEKEDAAEAVKKDVG